MAEFTSSPVVLASPEVQELVTMRSHVCLPGDPVLALGPSAVVGLGDGLRALHHNTADGTARTVVVSEVCAAVDRRPHPAHMNVPHYAAESPSTRRYMARAGDPVVAIVAKRVSQQCYHCYVGGQALAYMDALGFDGATKTSRPRLVEGDVVYAYVKPTNTLNLLNATADGGNNTSSSAGTSGAAGSEDGAEVELSCLAAAVGLTPKDWTSGESVFGPLEGGRVLHIPLPYARSLLAPPSADGAADSVVPASYLLSRLGQRVPFEVCIGVNGVMWVKGQPSASDGSAAARRTVAVSACIMEAQYDSTREEMDARIAAYFPDSA